MYLLWKKWDSFGESLEFKTMYPVYNAYIISIFKWIFKLNY